MTPFHRATAPLAERERLIREYTDKWNADQGDYFRRTFGVQSLSQLLLGILDEIEADPPMLWRNDTYQVAARDVAARQGDAGTTWPRMIHLSIKRIDKQPLHDWRDIQEIKNQIVGPEHEAVELYPAESRCVDLANQYHVWVIAEEGVGFPFGFGPRAVSDEQIAGSKQRPFTEGSAAP